MRTLALWMLVVGALAIMALTGYFVVERVRGATAPVEGLAGQIGTQVAVAFDPEPTVRPDPVTVVREVRALARLETIEYHVEKVITAETGQGPFGFLFGDRLLLVAHGTVIAGVDLGRLELEDVWFDEEGRVYLRLPEPELFVTALDSDATYIYDRETGLLRRGDVDLETVARQAAEAEIRRAALEDGILEQARVNAEEVLYRLLRSLGFSDVIFST